MHLPHLQEFASDLLKLAFPTSSGSLSRTGSWLREYLTPLATWQGLSIASMGGPLRSGWRRVWARRSVLCYSVCSQGRQQAVIYFIDWHRSDARAICYCWALCYCCYCKALSGSLKGVIQRLVGWTEAPPHIFVSIHIGTLVMIISLGLSL